MYVNVVLHIPEFAILKNNSMLIIYYDETKRKTRNMFVKADTSYVSWGDKLLTDLWKSCEPEWSNTQIYIRSP